NGMAYLDAVRHSKPEVLWQAKLPISLGEDRLAARSDPKPPSSRAVARCDLAPANFRWSCSAVYGANRIRRGNNDPSRSCHTMLVLSGLYRAPYRHPNLVNAKISRE